MLLRLKYLFYILIFLVYIIIFDLFLTKITSLLPFNFRTDNGSVKFDVIFGPAYKGISLGAVVCASLYNDFGIDVGFAYDRKEAKDHGEGGKLVGASMKDKRILVVDDVITAGTAIRESHVMLTQVGAIPVGVAIALDRAEKRSLDDPISAVQAVARDLEIPVISIVSLPQLQSFLRKSPDFSDDILDSVSKYRSQYGV
jgi:orotate phosphoribosyltransferase